MLHIPYTYFPDAAGGTEVYVSALAARLNDIGFGSAIAAPAAKSSEYRQDGLTVYRFATTARPSLEHAYGFPDQIAAEGFREIVALVNPKIVHLHARTAAVSERLVDVAHAAGARVVFTYHTPTVSCARGTMLLFGKTPCDGRVDRYRCATCTLAGLGVPVPMAGLAAGAAAIGSATWSAFAGSRRLPAVIRIPDLIMGRRRLFFDLMAKVDHVVAVCGWVAEILYRNGVPESKVTLSRQGLSLECSPGRRAARPKVEPLQVAYFGRLDPTKGIDTLIDALARSPDLRVTLDIYAIASDDTKLTNLYSSVRCDKRIRVLPPVESTRVTSTMATYDLIAVPSRGLETGPLVVLEAFAAGIPVIGSNRGGIAELVQDGVNGILVAPDDVAAWSHQLSRLEAERHLLARLASNIVPPRTMKQCAAEMAGLYSDLLSRADD